MSTADAAAASGWVLALHSSSDVLGVALQPLGRPEEAPALQAFPMGRGLANGLLPCVEEVLPACEWSRLARLAVATGPGGFTGTRLTVAMARTLCQQLDLPLDGYSSFHLIARRVLGQSGSPDPILLVQELPRHGLVAGLYRADDTALGGVLELCPPRLHRSEEALLGAHGPYECHPAHPLLPEDVGGLLAFSQEAARRSLKAPWASVVPLYPTSPVETP